MIEQLQENVVVVPAPEYALDWVACFKNGLPELKDRAREIYLTLTGHADWDAMVNSCSPSAEIVDFETLTPEMRCQKSSRMRKLLVECFNIRPTVANHVAWLIPPGCYLWELHTLESSALLQDGVPPNLEQIYAELDAINMGYCASTEQGQSRLNRRPEIGAHLGLCKFLGWDLEVVGDVDQQLTVFKNHGLFVAEPIGFVKDPDLGRVPVFVAGFSSTPGHAHDQVLVEYLAAALATAELLGGDGAPGIVFYDTSACRKKDGDYYSCFGSVVINSDWKDLFLNESCNSVGDLLVNLMTTKFQESSMAMFADRDLYLQQMFEKARQKHLLPPGTSGTIFGIEGPSGWSNLELRPNP
ncbi:hypothetical protein [Pseudomonas baetica]|uniref:hypothetical protein n=1 Tax=Pseudomonas baetica TaxID=674054 RepID=UPI0024072820|nr:hypothetical protein [Pseudomonas baetica]MDF9778789.1 hypothetical protein [Pseudomonas baetica]